MRVFVVSTAGTLNLGAEGSTVTTSGFATAERLVAQEINCKPAAPISINNSCFMELRPFIKFSSKGKNKRIY
jgi:hypothetical protein